MKYSKIYSHESDTDVISDPGTPYGRLNDRLSALFETSWSNLAQQVNAYGIRDGMKVLALSVMCVLAFFSGFLAHYLQTTDRKAFFDTAWPSARDGLVFETREFNPHFSGPPSPYMGEPNADIDARWYKLSGIRNFGVDSTILQSINRSRGAVQFKDTGLYQVGMEVFHQLHCLNYIRMYTYMDHYGATDFDMVGETLEERRHHKDHCIENLRQRLMCSPDLNVYSHHWVNRHKGVWVNLFTSHRCANWDHFERWAMENVAHTDPPFTRPEGAEVWD